jgi:hypothetical protein
MTSLVKQYVTDLAHARGIVLDANVALLYVVGSIDPKLIPKHDRTSAYHPNDFWTVQMLVSKARSSFTIPHTLTEISNLGDMTPRFRLAFRDRFRDIEELNIKSIGGFDSPFFIKSGLTDAILVEVALQNYLVVTADHGLYSIITSQNKSCINFNYLKDRP